MLPRALSVNVLTVSSDIRGANIMPYIYSTLANDQLYTIYHKQTNPHAALARKAHQVLIKGKAHIARGVMGEIYTPKGVRTEVSDADLEILEKSKIFQKHKANHFIMIEDSKINANKAARDMDANDPARPKTPADFPKEGEPEAGTKNVTPQPRRNMNQK